MDRGRQRLVVLLMGIALIVMGTHPPEQPDGNSAGGQHPSPPNPTAGKTTAPAQSARGPLVVQAGLAENSASPRQL